MKSKLLYKIFIVLGFFLVLDISAANKQLFKKNLFKKNLLNAKIISSSPKQYYNNASLFSSSGAIKQESLSNKPVASKKMVPQVQQKYWFKTFGFNKSQKNMVPSLGYFAQKLYTTQRPESPKRVSEDKIITIDPDKPESEKQVRNIIKTWKPQHLGGKRFYSGRSIIKKTARGVLGILVATVAAGVAYLYDRYINVAHESKTPLPPTQETYRYPEKFYKYALDGELVTMMNPLEFVKELHKDGLTC